MKKIIILLGIFIAIIILYLVHFYFDFFVLDIPSYYRVDSQRFLNLYYPYSIEVITVIALIIISLGLKNMITKGLFANVKHIHFSIGGLLFISIGIVDIVYAAYSITSDGIKDAEPSWIYRIFINCLLLILGLISIIVSDILRRSYKLKQENDLTI